ncbi:MAG: hypothetical protein RR197_06155, partial [Oscillospiraceae bacterium]
TEYALKKAGMKMSDIDLVEINEAFASVVMAWLKETGYDHAKTNVNGGAIALGHPLGCSGNRISVTLIHEMMRRGVRYGLASLCVAGGQGLTVIYENMCL